MKPSPDPDLRQSKKPVPVPHTSIAAGSEAVQAHSGAMKAHLGTSKADNRVVATRPGAVKGLWPVLHIPIT
jgi:hypothetical protein